MPFTFRQALELDADALCAILNPIIQKGGTTAYMQPIPVDKMFTNYIDNPLKISCILVEENGQALAFQMLKRAEAEQLPYLSGPENWSIIASFAKLGQQARGVGVQMFEHTVKAARDAGVTGIDATIRADNVAGLAYYSRIGFKDFTVTKNAPLGDGTHVDRIHKLYYL